MERGQFQAWAEKQTQGPILWKIQNKDKGRIPCLKTPYLKLWGAEKQGCFSVSQVPAQSLQAAEERSILTDGISNSHVADSL